MVSPSGYRNGVPRTVSMSSTGRPPARSRTGAPSSSNPTMVDSIPTGQGPASSTAAIRPERPFITWMAVVGLIAPDGFADGAATGRATVSRSARATAEPGTRTPRVGRPARARSETPPRCSATRVSGPGQNAVASASPIGGNAIKAMAASRSATWAISGLNRGRPFASKIRATASPLVASAPSP